MNKISDGLSEQSVLFVSVVKWFLCSSAAGVACVISFLITGHRSVYPAQALSVRKLASVVAAVGTDFRHVEVEIQPVEGGLIHTVRKVSGILGAKIHKRHDDHPGS